MKLWSCIVLLTLSLAACGATSTPGATPTAVQEATALPTSVPAPTALETVARVGEPIQIPEAGLSVQPPAGWERLAPDWAWAAPEVEGQRVGLDWAELQPPAEPEAALLPAGAQVLSSEADDVPLGQARRVTLEVYGPAEAGQGQAPVTAVEMHVLVVTTVDGQRRGYDFYASAPTADDLAALRPVLDEMAQSAELLDQ